MSRQNDKYYKKFDFFYRRTSFRTMTEFYKGGFKPLLEQWRDYDKKINILIQQGGKDLSTGDRLDLNKELKNI